MDIQVKFILVWRGRGIFALASLILPTLLLAIVINWSMSAAILCYGIGAVVAGIACVYFGGEWNQGSGEHMMYWIPLEIWGWIWGLLGIVMSIVGVVKMMSH